MKRLVGMQLLLAVLAGCGPVGLTQEQEVLARMNSEDVLRANTSKCESSYRTSLKEVKNTSLSPRLIFTANTNHQVQDKKLSKDPSLKEQCLEVENSLHQAPVDFRLELNFTETMEQADQMRNGIPAKIRPDSARLDFTDGSLNNAYTELKLRCPDAATVACKASANGNSPCESHNITYSGKCTFSSGPLYYTFSDLKKTELDLEGEIEFLGANKAEISFNSVSWRRIY